MFSLRIPVLFIVPAFLVAGVARVMRLHDKVSDWFRIRERFDLYRILIPLCGAVGIAIDVPLSEKLKSKRHKAMARFYRYASFEDPKISKALVLSAIDLWTWYWILLEAMVLLALAGVILIP